MKVPYGIADFKTIREGGYLYVDKTKYIEELEKYTKVIYTRPRRFGKSTFTNMIGYYYDIAKKDEFEKLFKGLYIYDNPTPKKNSYYIMYFNFSGIKAEKQLNKKETEQAFNKKIIEGCKNFIEKYNLNIEFEQSENAATILHQVVSSFQRLKKQNQIYIMIDEYDHFTNGMLKGNAEDFLEILGDSGFVRNFYEVIKENCETMDPPIGEFFATGVSPITLDSLTSGFNIATKITTDESFTVMCGLTEEEVKNAIIQAGITGKLAEETYNRMKENYDGYRMSKYDDTPVFNTTLVMYYLKILAEKGRPPETLIDDNLTATGTKIENMAGLMDENQNYTILDELLKNGYVEGDLVSSFELEKKFDRDDFISLLYYNGYVTMKKMKEDDYEYIVYVIPNYVTKMLYASYFLNLTDIDKKFIIDTTEVKMAIKSLARYGEMGQLAGVIQNFLFHHSIRDKETFNEMNIKHTMEILLSFTSQYNVYGEYPAGQGFADIFIEKATNSIAKYEAIVELKYLKKKDEKNIGLNRLEEDAKEQLNKYMKDKRIQGKEYLKKYMIIFKGFEDYIVKEL